jgi:hypothetical protein
MDGDCENAMTFLLELVVRAFDAGEDPAGVNEHFLHHGESNRLWHDTPSL